MKLRVSPLMYVIGILMALELILAILCLSLPWGKTANGSDIRFQLAGLLPWFGFIPVLLQGGFLVVDAGPLQTLYLVLNFLIGAFILLVQYLTHLKYSNSEFGFYLVFALGGLVIITGIICLVEKRLFSRMTDSGKARGIPVTFGEPRGED
jgi:hypothetical protein